MPKTYETIRHTILSGNLLTDGSPTRAAVDRLAQQIADALAAAFPGASVEVPVQWRTSGAGPRTRFYPDATIDDEERAESIAGRAWEQWCQALTDSDYERPES